LVSGYVPTVAAEVGEDVAEAGGAVGLGALGFAALPIGFAIYSLTYQPNLDDISGGYLGNLGNLNFSALGNLQGLYGENFSGLSGLDFNLPDINWSWLANLNFNWGISSATPYYPGYGYSPGYGYLPGGVPYYVPPPPPPPQDCYAGPDPSCSPPPAPRSLRDDQYITVHPRKTTNPAAIAHGHWIVQPRPTEQQLLDELHLQTTGLDTTPNENGTDASGQLSNTDTSQVQDPDSTVGQPGTPQPASQPALPAPPARVALPAPPTRLALPAAPTRLALPAGFDPVMLLLSMQ
jgi:hypothetical protein